MAVIRTILALSILPIVIVGIYVYNTEDSSSVDFYDCFSHKSLFYCRRPKSPIRLNRSNNSKQCYHNGILHSFSNISLANINISTMLHNWNSSIEKIEHYSRYNDGLDKFDEDICECTDQQSFGKNCEYKLPMGTKFMETFDFENILKASNSREVQLHGDIICYITLECDSGLLCLDWRDICDGVQQCMSGFDEANCEKLEFNECEKDEYRCMNGMCIPEEYFLDGEFDCLDWSDEIQYYDDLNCQKQGISNQCDDRICPPYQYSCGDGQCIEDRFDFQTASRAESQCRSRRDQYFICETHYTTDMWTLPNGRCYEGDRYNGSSIINRTNDEQCQYILLCDLSGAYEAYCPCGNNSNCIQKFYNTCRSNSIQYPSRGIMAPYILFFYPTNYTLRPHSILVNGTIKCNGVLVNISDIYFQFTSKLHQLEHAICQWAKNASLLDNHTLDECYHSHTLTFNNHTYNTTNICKNSTACLSVYRLKDGFINCIDRMDEIVNISTSGICSNMQRYRFRCAANEPTCMSVGALGNSQTNCKNTFDEFWFGTSTTITDINCNDRRQEQCEILRQYVAKSWSLEHISDVSDQHQIPFRSYCDTFWNLHSQEDENIKECQQWWTCSEEQWQCDTGQCIDEKWVLDAEWDCPDASDESHIFYSMMFDRNQRIVDIFEFENRSSKLDTTIPFSRICNLTTEFPCLLANISTMLDNFTHNRPCISRNRIGDGKMDCYGGIDERNTEKHCTQQTMLGYNFRCNSSDQCIPFWNHCFEKQRCTSHSDDQFWCNLYNHSSTFYNFQDAACFDGSLKRDTRCDGTQDCPYGEDEYMCERRSVSRSTEAPYRKDKMIGTKNIRHKLQLIQFPINSTVIKSEKDLTSNISLISISNDSTAPVAYWCNRGIGVHTYNDSIACFCPPQYYGDKCEFHADRVIVLLHINFSQSIYPADSDIKLVLKILVLFLIDSEIITNHQFHVRPSTEFFKYYKKTVHLLYSRLPKFLQHKKQRYFNQSSIIHDHPYSIRIEIYQRNNSDEAVRVAVWQYPIYFDYLPVFRLAKVLRLRNLILEENPCSSNPCHRNQECYPLLNDKSKHVCLCQSNFTGENCSIEDQHCIKGYCSANSLCKPGYHGLSVGNDFPYCICPFDRLGERCHLKHDRCLLKPCQNNGTCALASRPDTYVCLCTEKYYGSDCKSRKSETKLSINESDDHAAAVIQYFDIDFVTLNLNLVHQKVYPKLLTVSGYQHAKNTAPEIILVKLYSSKLPTSAELYLISVHLNVTSIDTNTQVIERTRCIDIRTLLPNNQTRTIPNLSPIRYHSLCRKHADLFCFRDDVYLCICDENHSRVDCFGYDNKLDQCSDCFAAGYCIRGDRTNANDFLCLCPPCYSGTKCQFNSNSFTFTLDQLFFTDLTSTKKNITICLLIIGSLILAIIALPNNIFSFMTFRREKCLFNGIGQYLHCMSIINQLNICVFIARLIHLTVTITSSTSYSIINNIFCKILSYLLSSFTRVAYWLVAFVAIERVYTTLFLKGQWLKRPHIARRLIALTFFIVFTSSAYELAFIRSVFMYNDRENGMCIIIFPSIHQTMWIRIHQIVTILHSTLPLLINLYCTMTMVYIITRTKMNIHMPNKSVDSTAKDMNVNINVLDQQTTVQVEKRQNDIKTKESRYRLTTLRDVLSDHREMISRPAVTLIPSIFSLFSLPLLIASFSLGCHNLESSPVRYLLITFYFISFVPQIMTFFLYVYPSSLYFNEWCSTRIGQWLISFKHQTTLQNTAVLSIINEETLKSVSTSK